MSFKCISTPRDTVEKRNNRESSSSTISQNYTEKLADNSKSAKMRSVFFISTLGSLASGFALPNFPVKGHEWIPATPEDSEFAKNKSCFLFTRKD
jgi:hypothetical protein